MSEPLRTPNVERICQQLLRCTEDEVAEIGGYCVNIIMCNKDGRIKLPVSKSRKEAT